MCTIKNLSDVSIVGLTHAVPTSQSEADELFDLITNGRVLFLQTPSSFTEKVAVSISTIAALMKEFTLDWSVEDLASASLGEKQEALRMLGYYCQMPVKTFNELMRKLVRVGLRQKRNLLDGFIQNFLTLYNPSKDRMLLLCSYLYTAFKAVRMSKPKFSTPFMIDIDRKGRAWFCYFYRSSRTGRTHVRRYNLDCKFGAVVGAAGPSMAQLFMDK